MGNKITVTSKGEAWRALARMVPTHIEPVGTLTRNGSPHAFGRDAQGEYWIFGDGRPERVPRIRIEKGLGALAMRQDPKTLTRFKAKTPCDAPAPCTSEKPG